MLKIEGLNTYYGDSHILRGVDVQLPASTSLGLLGRNGMGKTTLIRSLMGYVRPASGQVLFEGRNVTGWVPQEIINHGYFSVEEILHFQAGYYGVKNSKDRIQYLLNGLGLFEHRHKKVKQLSGGMKRRLMIDKALIHSPGLLLLDEPTAGVDVELRTRLWDFVSELRSEGLSILLTTHYLEEAEHLCDRVAIIHKGELREIGPTRALIEKFSRKNIILKLVDPVSSMSHPDLVKGEGSEWTFLTSMEKTLGQLLRELKVPLDQLRDAQVSDGRLEDVFVKLTQDKAPELHA